MISSFNPRKQDLMVGSQGVTGHYQLENGIFLKRGVERYTEKRNTALVNLVRAGFNSPEKGQRLSLIMAPLRLDVWAARRNIPLVIAPTMESGPKAKGLMHYNQRRDPNHEKLKNVFLSVYHRAIREGIMSIDAVRERGVSAYMGTAACNQVANGLYIRLNGQVQMCPGSSADAAVFGNIHERSIADIWRDSPNSALGELENNWCMAKTQGMPRWLQDEIYQELTDVRWKQGHDSKSSEQMADELCQAVREGLLSCT